MDSAPIKDPLFGLNGGLIKSPSWVLWFNKLVAYIKSVSANGVTSVSADSPLTSTGGVTPTIRIPAANSSNSGYLTSSDWATFNGKFSNQMSSNKLLGRNSANTGAIEEIALGTGLTFSNATLNAAVTAPGGNNTELQYNANGVFAGVDAYYLLANKSYGIGSAATASAKIYAVSSNDHTNAFVFKSLNATSGSRAFEIKEYNNNNVLTIFNGGYQIINNLSNVSVALSVYVPVTQSAQILSWKKGSTIVGGITKDGYISCGQANNANYAVDANGYVNAVSGFLHNGNDIANIYAPIAKGVTNGDTHDHNGGDGSAIVEAALSLSNVTTWNANANMHGFCPKLSANANDALRGDGTWGAVSGSGVSGITFFCGASNTDYGDMTVIIGGNSSNG